MRNGEEIITVYERKFGKVSPISRSYLKELIEIGLNETFELGKKEALKMFKERIKSEKH